MIKVCNIKSNKELIQMVKREIKASGLKKNFIADKLGTSRQNIDNLLKKKSFSIDDANKILSALNEQINVEIEIFPNR